MTIIDNRESTENGLTMPFVSCHYQLIILLCLLNRVQMETMSIYIYSTEAMDSRQRSYGYVTYVKVTLAWLMDS